jgi:hypothetical protein
MCISWSQGASSAACHGHAPAGKLIFAFRSRSGAMRAAGPLPPFHGQLWWCCGSGVHVLAVAGLHAGLRTASCSSALTS